MSEDTEFADVTAALRHYQPMAPGPATVEAIAAVLVSRPSSIRRWLPLGVAAAAILVAGTYWIWPRSEPVPAATFVFNSLSPQQAAEFKQSWQREAREVVPFQTRKGGVTIVIFMDWLCPGCLVLEGDLRAVLAPLEREYPGRIAVIYVDWPWDTTCNSAIPSELAPAHPGACELATAVRRARARGRGTVLIDWIKQHRTDWQAIGLPAEFRLPPGEPIDPAVKDSIAKGQSLGISRTPTMFINGVRITQIMPAGYIDLAVRIELESANRKR